MSAMGEGGAQKDAGFGAGAESPSPDSASLTQGLSPQDMAAMEAAGVKLVGPGDELSTAEAAVMQPQSMGGTGKGGSERAAQFQATGGSTRTKSPGSTGDFSGLSSSDAPPSQPGTINDLMSMIAAMQGPGGMMPMPEGGTSSNDAGGGGGGGMNMGSFAGMMADGGEVEPGQHAIVGEEGPEVVQAGAEGGATVTPFRAAQAPPESFGRRALRKVSDIATGAAVGPQGVRAIQAGRAEATQRLAQTALQNPTLLRMSPAAVKAVDRAFGAGTSQAIVSQGDPNVQARAMAQMLGITLMPAGQQLEDGTRTGSETAQLQEQLGQFGYGMSMTSKGEMRITKPARSAADQDALTANALFGRLQKAFREQGLTDSQADFAASKRLVEIGANNGFSVPEVYSKLALSDTQTAIEANRAAQKAFAKGQVDLGFAGPKAAAAEGARRGVRLDQPITQDEVIASNTRTARALGGTVYGRDLSDDDLLNADSQGLVFKQQADGSFLGIPKDKVREDALVLTPSELLTKRVLQKMAAKQTTQSQNAKIVIDALDALDNLDAMSLLPHTAPQGESLGSKLIGAAKTELAGQTSGRATVWAARRSPDPVEREKAIALINLRSLTTAVVKALGDVGAISEADKQVIKERFDRIAAGTASREEGATQAQHLRRMMMTITARGNVTKGSPQADALADEIHEIVTTRANPTAPPKGYQPIPGTGAFYSYE